MMLEKFGKTFRDYADVKSSFLNGNETSLSRSEKYAKLYIEQPRRVRCKVCDASLPTQPSFVKQYVPYVVCTSCSHLNGMHEDTDIYCHSIYTHDDGKEYAEGYSSTDVETYIHRRERIYAPKAQFLIDALRHYGEEPNNLRYADMGAGAGYFVAAMQDKGIKSVKGYEVSRTQVSLGNWVIPSSPLELIALQDTSRLCRTISIEVISFIGVLEHLQNPREVLSSIVGNNEIKYVYMSLPMFSPCVYNESVFSSVAPRQLTTGHTHLFTDESISHIEREFGLERIAAWWFGTDAMDYYRSVAISMMNNPEQKMGFGGWNSMFEDLIDDLQLVIDKKRKSSQVHILFRKAT